MPTKTPPTSRSTPKLSDLARHVRAPKGVVSTGWPAVEKKCRQLGISFRPWQPDVGRLILAKRADGKYAATIGGTGLSIPRQVGKTFLVGAIIFALCLLRPKLTVIWTAHRVRTAEETFGKMQAFAKRRRIKPFIEKIVLGSGEEEVRFRNGSRILFGARESGFGLGFDEVDVLIFDEAQRLRSMTLEDMIPATNQSRQETSALLLFMGTPPRPTDPGEVFTRMRTEALSGEDDDTGWVEFGADEDHEFTPLPAPLSEADWAQIAKANPSFPDDTPREAILRMRKKLGTDPFKREGAGIWDKVDLTLEVIPAATWDHQFAEGPAASVPPTGIAVDQSHDGVMVVAGCWRSDESHHLELLRVDPSPSDEEMADWVAAKAKRRIPIIIDAYSPAARLIPLLKARKCKVLTGGPGDMSKACVGLYTGVMGGTTTHGGEGDELVGQALAGAIKRKIGDAGGWGWDRRDPETNAAPLVAETLAHYVTSHKKPTTGNGRTASSGNRSSSNRKAVVM